jgi:amino acid transporter
MVSIPAVAVSAAGGTWLAFLLATVGVILVAANINAFARDSSGTGSLYDYIARSLGATVGVLGGWALAIAYIGCGAACVPLVPHFLNVLLAPFHVHFSPLLVSVVLVGSVWYCAWKDMRLSAHLMLTIELSAVAVGTILALVILFKQGGKIDASQFRLGSLSLSGVGQGTVLAFMALVGFESAASLGDEARNPLRTIPRAIIASSLIAGAYFILHGYSMVAGFRGLPTGLAASQSPVSDVAKAFGVPILAIVLNAAGLVSSFSIVLASINAGARTLFLLSRHGVLPPAFSFVHPINRTPSFSVTVASLVALAVVIPMTLAGLPARVIWGYVGSVCTFGFLLAYLLITIGTPIYLRRQGRLRTWNLVVSALATVVVLLPIAGSLYPVPPYPQNLLIYIFAGLIAVGLGWFLILRARDPELVERIHGHVADSYERFAVERASLPGAAIQEQTL